MNHTNFEEEADTHLVDWAEQYRELALQTVHGHQPEFASRRRLPQQVRDWLYRGTGTVDADVSAVLEELRALRVLEVLEAVDNLRDRSGNDFKADALALLRQRLGRAA